MEAAYLERKAVGSLAVAVQRVWWLSMPSPQRFERIVPLPAVHLIVNLSADPYRVIARGRELVGHTFSDAFISGVQLDYLLNENPPEVHHVGVALHPWAVGAFGLDPSAIAQRVVEVDAFLPGINQLRETHTCGEPSATMAALEAFLLRRLVPGWRPDQRVVAAVSAMVADPVVPMSELAVASGLTWKGFIGAFRRSVGLTPKRFAEICRHQAFLAEWPDDGAPRWTDVVGAGRYYDQPHFIREFRRFTGMTPTAYFQHRTRFGHRNPSFLPMDDELLAAALRG